MRPLLIFFAFIGYVSGGTPNQEAAGRMRAPDPDVAKALLARGVPRARRALLDARGESSERIATIVDAETPSAAELAEALFGLFCFSEALTAITSTTVRHLQKLGTDCDSAHAQGYARPVMVMRPCGPAYRSGTVWSHAVTR